MGIPWDGMGWDRHNLLWDGMGWDRKICPMDKPGNKHVLQKCVSKYKNFKKSVFRFQINPVFHRSHRSMGPTLPLPYKFYKK